MLGQSHYRCISTAFVNAIALTRRYHPDEQALEAMVTLLLRGPPNHHHRREGGQYRKDQRIGTVPAIINSRSPRVHRNVGCYTGIETPHPSSLPKVQGRLLPEELSGQSITGNIIIMKLCSKHASERIIHYSIYLMVVGLKGSFRLGRYSAIHRSGTTIIAKLQTIARVSLNQDTLKKFPTLSRNFKKLSKQHERRLLLSIF